MYADYFKLCYTYWLIKDNSKTRLIIRALVKFIQKPNYLVKSELKKSILIYGF